MRTKIDSVGRVQIPKMIRNQLGVIYNDELNIECIDNKIVLSNINDRTEFLIKREAKLQTIEQIFKNEPVDLKKLSEVIKEQ